MRGITFAVAILLSSAFAFGQAAQPGSSDYKPTPQSPAGWRGDWTGRFPGAQPPVEWCRLPEGVKDLLCQADRPQGDKPGAEAASIRIGIIPQWLVLGPFDPKDKALDEEILANEAEAQPADGQAAGEKTWQKKPANFFYADFGPEKPAKDQVWTSYAHTYIHAPQPTKARLQLGHSAGLKVWLNGKSIYSTTKPVDATWSGGAKVPIELSAGWNRLLLKGSAKRIMLIPAAGAKMVEKNILWTTRMPAPSVAQPVVLGDRLYLCAEPSDLVCVNKADGKILWIRSNHFGTVAQQTLRDDPTFKEKVQPLMAQLDAAKAKLIQQLNDGKAPDAAAAKKQTDAEWKIYDELKAIDGKYARKGPGQYEWASPTPCTDGERIYAVYTNGVAAAYDPDGKLVWASQIEKVGGAEHGQHFSPVLIAGKLIISLGGTVTALDADSGKVAWEAKASAWLTPSRIGDTDVVVASRGTVLRVSDGKPLCDLKLGNAYGWSTPTMNQGVMYDYLSRGDRSGGWFVAAPLPATADEGAKGGAIKRIDFTDKGLEEGWYDSSLLWHDGLVYAINSKGDLMVHDFAAGQTTFKQRLAMYAFVQYVVMPGVSSSPALGGNHIYLTDNQNTTIVIEPGRQPKIVARNIIENNTYAAMGAWGRALGQEQTLSSLIFDGGRIYLRGQENLYCIGER